MAVLTPTVFADDLELSRPPLYGPVKTNRMEGRVRCVNWKLTLASEVSGTIIAVGVIPKSARLILGTMVASATLANSATLAVGLSAKDASGVIHPLTAGGVGPDDVTVAADVADGAAILKAAAAQSTTFVPFIATRALGYLYELQKECWLTLTTGTGTVSTEVVAGHCLYVID